MSVNGSVGLLLCAYDILSLLPSVMLFDKDMIGKDDFMGEIVIKLDESIWKNDSKMVKPKKEKYLLKGRKGKKDQHVNGELSFRIMWESDEMEERIKEYQNTCAQIYSKKSDWEKKKEVNERAKKFPDLPLYEAVLSDNTALVRESKHDMIYYKLPLFQFRQISVQ